VGHAVDSFVEVVFKLLGDSIVAVEVDAQEALSATKGGPELNDHASFHAGVAEIDV